MPAQKFIGERLSRLARLSDQYLAIVLLCRVLTLEHQTRHTQVQCIRHERFEAQKPCPRHMNVRRPNVDAGSRTRLADRRQHRAPTTVSLLGEVDAALPRKSQLGKRRPRSFELTRLERGRGNDIAMPLGLVHENMVRHVPFNRSGSREVTLSDQYAQGPVTFRHRALGVCGSR